MVAEIPLYFPASAPALGVSSAAVGSDLGANVIGAGHSLVHQGSITLYNWIGGPAGLWLYVYGHVVSYIVIVAWPYRYSHDHTYSASAICGDTCIVVF